MNFVDSLFATLLQWPKPVLSSLANLEWCTLLLNKSTIVVTPPKKKKKTTYISKRSDHSVVWIGFASSIARIFLCLISLDGFLVYLIFWQFAVLYGARANTGIDRMKIIDAVAKSVPEPHKVDLSNPDLNIVVEICKVLGSFPASRVFLLSSLLLTLLAEMVTWSAWNLVFWVLL